MPTLGLLQDTAPEESTSPAGPAEEVGEETASTLERVFGVFEGLRDYIISPEFVANVIVVAAVAVLCLFFYRVILRLLPLFFRWRREPLGAEDIARQKRQDTAIALTRNVLRYAVFVIVVLVAVSIFLGDVLPALAGATVVATALAFGASDLIKDIIAGTLLLLEDQFEVGDFVEVEPYKVSGIVEEFGLHATKIRTDSGELIFVRNGFVGGMRSYVSGHQQFTIEVQLRGQDAVARAVDSLGEVPRDLYLSPPRLMGKEELGDDRVQLRIRAGVLPSMAWLIEENLTQRIKAAAGDEALVFEPLIYKVDRAQLERLKKLSPEERGG